MNTRTSLVVASFIALFLAACSFQPVTLPNQGGEGGLETQASDYVQLGGPVDTHTYSSSMALDSSGNPVVSLSNLADDIYVKRWNGSSWVQLGGILDANTNQISRIARNPSLALDSSGNPVVSWSENDGTSSNIYVKRWNGSSWVQLGVVLDIGHNRAAYDPSLAVDSLGNPVVSWTECGAVVATGFDSCPNSNFSIYVKRWNGSTWVQLGTSLNVNNNQTSYDPSLAVDSSGNPVVSWEECTFVDTYGNCQWYTVYVKRWNGSNWVQLGTSLDVNSSSYYIDPSLAVGNSGNPVVSLSKGGDIYVQRWNGSTWVQLGGILDVNPERPSGNSSLALDSLGNPVVSWAQCVANDPDGHHYNCTNTLIYVKRWNGSSWVQLGTSVNVNNNSPYVYNSSLALDSSGNPVVSWEIAGTTYVKRYMTNIYLPVGEALDSSSSVSSTSPSLARRSDNKAVVAYLESNNTAHQLLVKQWNGSNWQGIGSTLNVNAQNAALNPDLKLQSNNSPTVSFEENGNIYVKSWNGSSWQQLGTSLDTLETNLAESPSLALQRLSANLNRPVVAWSELAGSGKGDYNLYVKRWDGSNWVQLGSAIDVISTQGAREPAVALLSNDTPVVAWQEFDGVSTNIYVKRWNGTAWVQLGSALDTNVANGAVTPTLAVASDNKVYVGWVENVSSTNSNIYAKYWNGTSWLSLGTILDNNAAATVSAPSIAMNSSNRPVLSWSEVSGSSTDVLVKTWNGSTWAQTGPILDRVASRNASKPSLVLSTGNLPMVAWQEEITAANWDVFVSSY